MYGTVAHVKALTNVQPAHLNQADQASLDALLAEWLQQATDMINGHLGRDVEAEIGGSTTLTVAADVDDYTLTVAAVTVFGVGDRLRVGSGFTREQFEITDVDRSAKILTLDGDLRYAHAVGETVARLGSVDAIPLTLHNCAERIVANMIGLAVQRRSTPIVRTDEFNAQLSSDAVFTKAIKDDLRPFRRRLGLFLA